MRRHERNISDKRLIEEIIKRSDICRVAMANGDVPYIVCMNFGYVSTPQPCLYFHCANEGRKLDMIRKNSLVCFEMDTDHKLYPGEKGCDWGMKYSSVVGYGKISIITENEAKKQGLDILMKHYGGEDEYSYNPETLNRTTLLKLDITEMTGKMC